MKARLGSSRCSQVTEGELPLLSAVTLLSEKTIRKKLTKARGNTLVRNVFEDDWPVGAAALSPLTVATAKRASLDVEIAAATTLGKRAVGNRLESKSGQMLLANAFPELEEVDDAEEDEDDEEEEDAGEDGSAPAEPAGWLRFRDGRRRFPPVELLAATKSVSVRSAPGFIKWLASVLGMSPAPATKWLRAVNGRAQLRTVFDGRWPPENLGSVPPAALGGITCAAARRSPSLVRLIADVSELSPDATMGRLTDAQGNAHVGTAIPEVLAAGTGRSPKPARTDSEPPPSSDRQSRILDGRYKLGRQLGKGTFGVVFEATRIHAPNLRVVVKLEIPDKPETLRNEIGIAYDLSHQNICSYKDYGRDRTLGTYVVLQHGGRSLEAVLEREGVIDLERALDVIDQAAAGLDYAHKHGVIHQDVKPGNILVGDDDAEWEVRVTDFGIALKGATGKNTSGKHTVFATHPVGYTPAYAAPEQRAGAKARTRSDQFALALVFCSMLEGEDFSESYEPRRFARLSSRQNDALMKALSEEIDDRFPSCSAFAKALRDAR